ncbi:MAG: tetratricopeptide repeat protein, partial [Candidatus Eremiobacteraeota bacterium]|nr:tetratricopeptide repeat protein [Candidatus Eremiobacteraeota bacterium]
MKAKVEKSLKELKALVKENPDDPESCYELGVAYARQGDMGLACRHWRKVLELDSTHTAAR